MTTIEQAYLRRRLDSIPKAALAEAIIVTTARVGGIGALLAAIAEQQNARTAQQARRRHRTAAQREVRA